MKRLLPILLIVFLLTACDLRNRQDSEDFIPDDSDLPAWTGWTVPTFDPNGVQPQSQTVKTVKDFSGELPYGFEGDDYIYQLPMIDLAGAYAAGCNQEIENRFGSLIEQSMDAIEKYETPILAQLTFNSYVRSGILTLCIRRVDTDGETVTAYYTVDEKTGEAVSLADLFSAAGMSGDPFGIVNEAVTELFTKRFGSLEGAEDDVTTALNKTMAALSPLTANRMHLTEDGSLAVDFELFAPNGGISLEEINLP